MPPIWKTKPQNSNLISPKDAMTTPRTMMPTLPRTFMFGGAMPKAQVARRTATAVVACKSCQFQPGQAENGWEETHFQHLDEGHGKREICQVAADECHGKHDPDGHDCPSAKPGSSAVFLPDLLLSETKTYMYVRVVIGTLWRESSVLVKRAMYWVMIVPKT